MGGPETAPSKEMGGPEPAPQTPRPSGCPGEAGAPLYPGFVAVFKASEVAPGAMKWVAVDRERVLVANVDGAFYALRDACGHRGAPLSRGTLVGHVVECPLHFACFDVRTGALLSGPAAADVPTYPVLVDGDTVYLKRSAGGAR